MSPSDRRVILYHAPQSRSAGVRALLEELGADYELRALNLKTGQTREPAYLAINPMGKVPAIVHLGSLITEQSAIYQYLADLYPEAGLAPQMGDPLRGPFLRWLAFYGSSFEPAVTDKAMKRDPAPPSMCPYGDFDTMMATIEAQLSAGPYILGDRFTSADVLWGLALKWMLGFGLVDGTPVVKAYVERIGSRPKIVAAAKADAELAAAQQA